MTPARSTHVVAWNCVALVAVAVAFGQHPSPAQQPSTDKSAAQTATGQTPEAPAETPVREAAKPKKRAFRGRLPAYYSRVVDAKQREQIYAIQREYYPKIEALRAQLAALLAERDEKVVAVLTPEQRKTVEKLKAEAKAKRDRARAAKKSAE